MKCCALLDSMQLSAKHNVATPVNWKPGQDVIIPTIGFRRSSEAEISRRLEDAEALSASGGAAEVVRVTFRTNLVTNLLARGKRMRSGDRPGLQNRRAASPMLPVCSTHTRFRHVFNELCRPHFDLRLRLALILACSDKNVITAMLLTGLMQGDWRPKHELHRGLQLRPSCSHRVASPTLEESEYLRVPGDGRRLVVVREFQKDQPEHWRGILAGLEVRVGAQIVSGSPEVSFELLQLLVS